MNAITTCKNIFYFLRYVFVKISGIIGVLLIMVGIGSVFFAQKSQEKALYFYLIIALIGYVVMTITSLLNLSAMNKRKIES